MVAQLRPHDVTQPEWALGYRFDIVLGQPHDALRGPDGVSAARRQTPSQTVGPFFAFGLIRGDEHVLVNDQTRGQRIIVRGHVFDGSGAAIEDAMVEIWQADAAGIFNHPDDPRHRQVDPHFRGFGRAGTSNRSASTRSRPSSRARCRGRARRCRPRTSACGSSRAACCSTC